MRDFVFEKFHSGTTVDLHLHISWDFRCQIREAAHLVIHVIKSSLTKNRFSPRSRLRIVLDFLLSLGTVCLPRFFIVSTEKRSVAFFRSDSGGFHCKSTGVLSDLMEQEIVNRRRNYWLQA